MSVKVGVLSDVWQLIYLHVSIQKMVEVDLGEKNKIKCLVWPSHHKLPFDMETRLYQRNNYPHTSKQSKCSLGQIL